MTLPRSEYEARLAAVRAAMQSRGLEALIVYSWKRGQVRYLTGYRPNYIANVAAALVPLEGNPTLFIRFPFDLERARRMCWFDDMRASGDMSALGRDVVDWLRMRGLTTARVGLAAGDAVMDEWPHSLHQHITTALPRAQFEDARDLVMALREVKSAAEMNCLCASARVTDLALEAAGKRIAPGVSESAIIAEAEYAARGAGAEEMLAVISAHGSRDLIHIPENKTAEAGEIVIVELAAQAGGYWTQAVRAFAVGAMSAAQREIYAATHAAYRAAVEAARAGRQLREIQSAVDSILGPAGFAAHASQDTGHGIGLDLPEPPRVDEEGEATIQPGHVLVLHPSVRVPGVGGAFLGGTVLVTERGPEPLHVIPEAF